MADPQGSWDWSVPDEEVQAFVNDVERPIGTHLYGRRMYDVLVAWETMDDPAPLMRDFAQIWRAARQDRLLDDAGARRRAPARGSSAPSTPRPCGS